MKDFQPYPSWRDHADGRERLVNSAEEDAALGEGWRPRAAEVEADASDSPAGREADAAAASGEFQSYPSWRHHVDGRTCIVQTEQEDDALGDGWFKDADHAAEEAARRAASGGGPASTDAGNDQTTASAMQAFHETPVGVIASRVAEATPDEAVKLGQLRRWEEAHPKFPGGRKGVLTAIDEKLAEFAAAPPTE